MAANVSIKTQRAIVILVVILTLLGLAAVRRGRVRSELGLPPAAEAGTIFGSLEFDGRTRGYLVHPPRGYRPGAPLPVVFVLHGATESNDGVEELSRMSVKADAEHFIAVYPAGTGRALFDLAPGERLLGWINVGTPGALGRKKQSDGGPDDRGPLVTMLASAHRPSG